jgi:hypothetical protein
MTRIVRYVYHGHYDVEGGRGGGEHWRGAEKYLGEKRDMFKIF